jgi:hypothetical protein
VNRKTLFCLLVLAVAFRAAQAQTFKLSVDGGGEAALWRLSSGQKEQVTEAEIGTGDTLFTSAKADAFIQLEGQSRFLVKSGSVVTLRASDTSVDIALEEGQVFLDRGKPHELASVRVLTKGYSFIPTGTAAAVKTTRQGVPTVAVLRGSVQMLSSEGGSVSVGARQFGTVNSSGALVSGTLNEKGLQQLEAWSGVTAEEVSMAAEEHSGDSGDNSVGGSDNSAQVTSVTEQADEGSQPQSGEAVSSEPSASAGEESKKDDDKKAQTPLFSSPSFELSAGVTTVDGEQWTRLALGMDLPVWRFGVFFDIELFIDPSGKLSDKGWDFKDNWADALARKIRYIRYGYEHDPLFVKFGGLSEVTLGYGIIMDRFTNMLRYPDEKLLGLQVYVNDFSPIGLYVQAVISDFAETKDKGGVGAARLAFKPLKTNDIPLLNQLTLGAAYAFDRNVYAPARKWKVSGDDKLLQDLRDKGGDLWDTYKELHIKNKGGENPDDILAVLDAEDALRDSTGYFDLYGFDAGLPIVRTSLLSVDLYGQYASRTDRVTGWGIGAPGAAVKLWRLNAGVEYRKIEGRFTPGYFDRYYLDERLSRGLLQDKSEYIPDVSLNGVFGRLGMDLYGLLNASGSYQYMLGDKDAKDRRFEAAGSLGETLISRIPKISLAEVYLKNTNIGMKTNVKYDKDGNPTAKSAGHFDRSPYMYWGYRAGFEIAAGATLILDYRYGWCVKNSKLMQDNFVTLQTALRF